MPALGPRSITDGVITIRSSRPGDTELLIAGRDGESTRWLGPGGPDDEPTACIVVGAEVVGWVDYDRDRAWLQAGEVNVGYCIFGPHWGCGYATRAVQLLMHHLALQGTLQTATLLIDPHNRLSLRVAERSRFSACGVIDGQRYFKRAVPPLSYTDGTVTLRCQTSEDVDTHLESVDDEQIDWLWLPGHRQAWEAMTAAEQRAHTVQGLQANQDNFGRGPKWTFSVDSPEADYVVYIDCDLANDHVPAGEANISYAAHPAHRSNGYVTRSVRLVCAFLTDHTAARHGHLIIDSENMASLGVARSIGAVEVDRWCNTQGRTMIRHLLNLTSSAQ